jgi:hypothetical protein
MAKKLSFTQSRIAVPLVILMFVLLIAFAKRGHKHHHVDLTQKDRVGHQCSAGCGTDKKLMDPKFNIREVVKQLILLEDHLANKEKHCVDCITKHALAAEGLAEEAISLDTKDEFSDLLRPLPSELRNVHARMVGHKIDFVDAGHEYRAIRKKLMPHANDVLA